MSDHVKQKTITQILTDGLEASVDGRGWGAEHENARRLANAAPELLAMLVRQTEKIERSNAIQHSGGEVLPEDWSELYLLTNEARALIAKAKGTP